jgi:hypothetical protein
MITEYFPDRSWDCIHRHVKLPEGVATQETQDAPQFFRAGFLNL